MKKAAILLLVCLVLSCSFAQADTTILYLITLNENPTTGYRWYSVVSDDTVLSVADHGYTAPESGDGQPVPGQGGERSWTVGGVGEGVASVTFTYLRPWELQNSDFIYTFTFLVDAGKNLSLLSTQRVPDEYEPGKALVQLLENRSTGYHWEMSMEPQGVLRAVVDTYEQTLSADSLVGSGGVHTWVFAGEQPGEVKLVLRYMPPALTEEMSEPNAATQMETRLPEPAATVVFSFEVDSKLHVTQRSIGGDYDQYSPYGRN
jgi:predicted secreted protein